MRRTRVGERNDDEGKAEVDTDVVLQLLLSAPGYYVPTCQISCY